MTQQTRPSFLLLFLLISFGSVTAVACTPALPAISLFFGVGAKRTDLVITLFLIGYAVGQLLYGPLANRFGRKIPLYIGISVEILASILCVLAAPLHAFWLLLLARLCMALGASVGLKMTFTLVADAYSQEEMRKIVSHLMLASAITPPLGVAIGGFLSERWGWVSTFYFMALYGLLMLWLTLHMPETAKSRDPHALKFSKIMTKYAATLKTVQLPLAGFIMGSATAFVYVFATLAPFIVMEWMHLSPSQYGLWNLVPSIGIIAGSQLSARLSRTLSPLKAVALGTTIIAIGTFIMGAGFWGGHIVPITLFIPLLVIYVGLGFVYANASGIATGASQDKSNASAMMSFINMGVATLTVLLLGITHVSPVTLLPMAYSALVGCMVLFLVILSALGYIPRNSAS